MGAVGNFTSLDKPGAATIAICRFIQFGSGKKHPRPVIVADACQDEKPIRGIEFLYI